ncbi:MAG: amidohydrolase family protein [Lentisphaeria bacterium]|nr:amidohydrolase family protein [Lentisphaeria bacterium]
MFDINTAIGHWPFRSIPNQAPSDLRKTLEAHGIRGAAAANTHGLFYKNCHDANRELADQLAPHADFFVGVATLNPLYPAWERDLQECVDSLGMRALRLVPQYHHYQLADDEVLALVRAAAALELPILIPHRVVDPRQHHWLDTEETVPVKDVVGLCNAVPEGKFVLTEFPASFGIISNSEGEVSVKNLQLEMSRCTSVYGQVLAQLVARCGADKVLFGSGAPFKEITPARLKLHHADISAEQRELIAGENARKLLGYSIGGTCQL